MQIHPTPSTPDDSKAAQLPEPKKWVRRHGENMVRVNLSISKELLVKVDAAAKQDYTTRSDMIRTALLWYLRPQGRELDQADPEVILKTLQRRKSLRQMNKMMKGVDVFED